MRRPAVVLLAFAAASAAALAAGPPEPAAAAGQALISLDGVPQIAYVGEMVTFSGWLTGQGGEPVAGRVVEIKDDDPGFDDFLASGATDAGGRFVIRWAVDAGREGDSTLEVYAVFEGDSEYGRDRTPNHDMTVRERAPAPAAQAPPPAAAGRGQASVTLDSVPRSAYDGEDVLFTGRLVGHDGSPLVGRIVEIKDNDPGRDDFLTSGVTDRGGYFAAYWTVDAGREGDGTLDIYAVFEGDSSYRRHQTRDQEMAVRERSGSITLDRVPHTAYAGETVTFTGRLASGDGSPLAGKRVEIKDDDFGSDDLLAHGVTDSGGRFAITWVADAYREAGDTLDIYAVFEGDRSSERLRSPNQHMDVRGRGSSVSLDAVPRAVHVGDSVTFTGRLLSGDGTPLAGRTIHIKDDDLARSDDLLVSASTDRGGDFAARWDAEYDWEGTLEVYAVFEGDSSHGRDKSAAQPLTVRKYGGALTLDPPPRSAREGDVVEFTGRLLLDGHGTRGSVVYIKDEDTANPDDLLAVAYPGDDGRFSIGWRVERTDPTMNSEIYAVFEGGERFERLVSQEYKLSVLEFVPTGGSPDAGQYMKLYYALDLDRRPHVHILPSPDSYDEVRWLIDPSMRGINTWTDMLEDKHGGDWDVTYEIVSEGSWYRDAADVQILLVRPDQENCNDWWGVADTFSRNPVYTKVCTSSGGHDLSYEDAAFTAGHEFIHAMGLGHAFNMPGDTMCSKEGKIYTCTGTERHSGIPQSYHPSQINLDAVAAIYGRDGFMKPNNLVTRGDRFYAGDPIGSDAWDIEAPSTGSGPIVTTGPTIRIDPDQPDPGTGSGQITTSDPSILLDPDRSESGAGSGPIVTTGPTVRIESEQQPGGGCLIATAAHGTELAQQVQGLREMRDGAILSGGPAAQVMDALHSVYYAVSPAVADLERDVPELRALVRAAIAPPAAALSPL